MAPSSSPGSSSSQDIFTAALHGDLAYLSKTGSRFDRIGEGTAKGVMEVKDRKGRTPLHYAAEGGRNNVCKYLVDTIKVNVNVRDFNGDTPLHLAVLGDKYLTSAFLLDHGADPNVAGYMGMTPLHRAAEKGRKDQLRLLISKGAEVNMQSYEGTPLQCAAEKGLKDAVKILLEHQADPNLGSRHMFLNPLIAAVVACSVDCVRLLIKHGANPNQVSHRVTPLVIAASQGETDIVKCLLKAGANPNATNFYDRTPIDVAALNGNLDAVAALFPFTEPIPSFPVWSIQGILEHVNSEDAKNQRKVKLEEKFLEAKAKGAEAVKNNEYFDAISWYSEAKDVDPEDASVLSNSSLCWARLNEGDYALKDAERCIKLRRDWPKAYYRAGAAWRILKNYKKAAEAFEEGLKLDPKNEELQNAYKDAMEKLQSPKSCSDAMSNLFGPAVHLDDNDDLGCNDDCGDGLVFSNISFC